MFKYFNSGNFSTVTFENGWVLKKPHLKADLKHELYMLRKLQGTNLVPKLHPDYLEGEPSDIKMEFIRGETLAEYVETAHPQLEEIIMELNNQLLKLEELRIIHGDLHDRNILVSPEDQTFKVIFIDFAWAFYTDEGPPNYIPETTAGCPLEVREDLISHIERSSCNDLSYLRNILI